MKNTIICSIAVLSAALLAACTETTRIWPEEGESKAYVEVSSQKVIFDADGGNAVITVATNADGWDYAAEGDWFTVARQDGNALLVETLINAGAETLTGKLTVSAEKNGETVSQEVALVQRAERSVNLSAEGTANCYIARTGGVYKFDASVKGNGGGDGVSDYIANYGLAIEDGAFAELLWESRHDGDKTMSREIIDGTPIYRGGYVTFSTGRSEGNAVIAVKDIKGNIVWSWHIWMTQAPAAQTFNGRTFLDRNVGATEFDGALVGSLGVYFQWGRKDPFIGANRIQKNYTDEHEGVGFQTTGDNGFTALFLYNDALCEGFKFVNKDMDMSVANPTVFYGVYNSGGWKGSNSEVKDYWGGVSGTKTNNDPCPAGYRVPTFDELNGFIKDIDTNKTTQENVSDQSYGRKYTIGDQTFMFPGSALRVWSAKMRYPGRVTFFWTATISPSAEKKALDFYDYRWTTNADPICCGMAIRCIRIE